MSVEGDGQGEFLDGEGVVDAALREGLDDFHCHAEFGECGRRGVFWLGWALRPRHSLHSSASNPCMFQSVDIKIGFKDSPRELTVSLSGDRDAVVGQIRGALEGSEQLLNLEDSLGRVYVVRVADISFVEIGTDSSRPVGFSV